ncbi:MAG: aminopeptidase N [Coxiellaceae bacterium]|nr:aminopeptidase N [Coxiellaceae bacterium]
MVAAEKPTGNSAPNTKYLSDYQPTDFIIENVHLHFDLHEDETLVKAILNFKRNPKAKTNATELRLDGEALELRDIALNGKALADKQYAVLEDALLIHNVPDKFTLETVVMIKPQENTELSGLYKSSGNYCTQCEPEGFRRITYFLDRPDVMTTFTTTITADKQKYPMLLANGNLIEERDTEGGRHWVKWEDPSLKPCYLFALVAGSFDLIEDTFTTMSGRQVALRLFLERGFLDQGQFAMDSLVRSMKWDEEAFGREYDLDIYMVVAVSDFNMGAMENKGLNVFNTKCVLARQDTATDTDYANIERVIGHEYFHNWSGNRITCRDWFQITLKEGLTVLREQLFCEDMTSPLLVRIKSANTIRNVQFAQDAGPMSHPIRPEQYIEINNFYTVTVYEKGSEVIRMVRTFLGKEVFRQAMDEYFSRYDGQAVTTEDFIAVMQEVSGKDLTQFCRWYKQGGTPELTVKANYDTNAKTLKLEVRQHCPKTPGPGQDHKLPYEMPLAMGFMSAEGEMPTQLKGEAEALTGTRILDITEEDQVFEFINVEQQPALSLLRDFSAPVKLHYAYSDQELLTLMTKDTNGFSRWDAAQQYFVRLILMGVEEYRRKGKYDAHLDMVLLSHLSAMLNSKSEDPQLLALLFTLPTENYLMQVMPEADVDAVHAVRNTIIETMAMQLQDEWLNTYNRIASDLAPEYSPANAAQRSLKNVALHYLAALGSDDMIDVVKQQFDTAENMTDSMAALTALNDLESPVRQQSLIDFRQRWHDEALVMDKWLAVQACSSLPNTLAEVKSIVASDAFNLLNPNNVRSLVGAFTANLIHFHAADGSGYAFLADQVIALDQHNRLTAARLCEPLIRWQKMDKARQKLMKQQLERIIAVEGLSPDVYEVVSASLA